MIAGNRVRMLNIIEQLVQFGGEVTFVHMNKNRGDPLAMNEYFDGRFYEIGFKEQQHPIQLNRAQKIDAKLRPNAYRYNQFINNWYDDSLHSELANIVAEVQPDIALIEYVMMAKALQCFDAKTTTVIDTHDLFANRYKKFMRAGVKPNWFSAFPTDEIRHLRKADYVLAIQHKEARYLSRFIGKKVRTVGHIAPLVNAPFDDQEGDPSNRLMFVGGQNAINLDAMNYFLDEIWPLVVAQQPKAELIVVGDLCEILPDTDGLIKVGAVADLKPSYQRTELVINPCRWGTGLKTKNLEALAHGKALVTTPHGLIGLEKAKSVIHIGSSPTSFANAIVTLLQDSKTRTELGKQGKIIANHFNRTQADVLASVFKGC